MKEEISHTDSFKIINEMIAQAKDNFDKSGSFYFLLWGWVVMVANLGHYALERFSSYEHPYIVWTAAIPAIIATIWYSLRQKAQATTRTHLTRLYGEVWLGVGVCLLLSLIFMSKINFNHTAVIMMVAGVGTYVSGRLLKFRPLLIGAVALWICSFVCFNLPMTDQYLAAAIGILAGYLIPGYMLKSVEK